MACFARRNAPTRAVLFPPPKHSIAEPIVSL
jgi:hypothetical protein